MSKFNTVKFETTRELDKDRAVYVVFEKGNKKIVNTYKQLDSCTSKRLKCITNRHHKAAYKGEIRQATPDEYREFCKMHKH